ncbi:protein transport protein SFT2 [Thrips palmi]|uniref:Vesicle transport protein n=1 Tax=Thrips palmi TaxID=161013 RepID=A0A6P8Z8E5_THRPL|nr:protein transport protein SFT2 [Thrips palmi]
MADLKKDLDDYLSRNSEKSQPKHSNLSLSFALPEFGKWTKKQNAAPEESSYGWFQETQKDCCPSMGRMQRIVGFCLCLFMGVICFSIAAFYAPVLLFKARKFALLYTMGSLFFLCSFSFLWGPMTHLRHLFSRERIMFTSCYFGTLFATLYFALFAQSTPLTVLCAVLQIIALLFFLASSIPGGRAGITFFTKIFTSRVSSSMNMSKAPLLPV